MTIQAKSFLVTGGTGFIGSALVRALVRAGARVRSLDNDSRGTRRRLIDVSSDVEMVVGDIRDPDVVRRATSGVDCVCHLAYINGTQYFYSKPGLVLDVAIRGMINVLDACRACGVGELVLASSSEVYQTPPTIPTDETVPLSIPDVLNPRYSYGGGKVACELMAINFCRAEFGRVVIFRPHNVYGPDMGREHVIPQFALRIRELSRGASGTIRFPIQGTGCESRSFVYIDDLIDGVVRIIDRGEHLGIYHIGTDAEITIADLARQIGRYFGRDLEFVSGELSPGSTLRRCPDISKMRALGFEPRVSLTEGLATTLQWYCTFGDTSD
jgi:nucleoside-diphosphate-sugar epimerase